MLVKRLENGERWAGDLPLVSLSHFSTEQISALLKLLFIFYLVLNRNDFS